MSEAHEIYDALKICSQNARRESREEAPKVLKRKAYRFEVNNHGAHIIIFGAGVTVDLWPGTGKWIARNNLDQGYGLIALMKVEGLKP